MCVLPYVSYKHLFVYLGGKSRGLSRTLGRLSCCVCNVCGGVSGVFDLVYDRLQYVGDTSAVITAGVDRVSHVQLSTTI